MSIAAALVLAAQAALIAAAGTPQAPDGAPQPAAVYATTSPMTADGSPMTAGGGAEAPPPPEAVSAVTPPATTGAAASVATSPMTAGTAAVSAADLDHHRALVRRYYDQVWNQFNLDEANKIFAPPFDVEGIQDTITHMHYGIPDIHFELHDMVAEGEMVAVAFTAAGTHSFELFGGAPTGNKIRFEGIEIFHFKDGKIVAKRTSYDRMGLLRQLGAPCKSAPQ